MLSVIRESLEEYKKCILDRGEMESLNKKDMENLLDLNYNPYLDSDLREAHEFDLG